MNCAVFQYKRYRKRRGFDMGNRTSRPERNSPKQTALIIACKTGNVAAVREILEWRDYDGERVDINARDENGQTALSIAKQSNNAEIVESLFLRAVQKGDTKTVKAYLTPEESNFEVLLCRADENGETALSIAKQSNNAEIVESLFLRAVQNRDTRAVKTYLTPEESNFEVLYCRTETNILNDHKSEQREMHSHEDDLIEDPPPKGFKAGFETKFHSKDLITQSVWLKAVTIAQHYDHYEMENLLLSDDRFIHGFNEDGQNILDQNVAEYLEADISSEKTKTLKLLFKSMKYNANVLNLLNETIFETVCKIKPRHCSQIDELPQIFLENCIDLNGRNKNVETFLMLACENKRYDIVRRLLTLDLHKLFLDFDENNSREQFIMTPAEIERVDIVRSLLRSAEDKIVLDIDAVDNSGETALMKAKRNNDSKIVGALLGKTLISVVKDETEVDDKNEDAMLKDDNFLPGFNEDEITTFYEVVAEYLEYSILVGNMKRAEILLKFWKFNAKVLNLQNETIFEIVCKIKLKYNYKIDDLLQILLQNGIDLNGRNKNGETFLILACKYKHIDIVCSLLDLVPRGFVLNIEAVDNSGKTALMKAKEKNLYEIVLVLLKFKFISAVKDKNSDIVKSMLPEFCNTLDISLKSWITDQTIDSKSLSLKVKWENKSDVWLEAVYIAMGNDTKHSDEILKLLLDCDILLSQEIETGHLSFYRLIHGSKVGDDRRLRLFELLLKSGNIDVNARNKNGRTALHWAQEINWAEVGKLIPLLIHYGADVNRKDNEGRTALMPISKKWGRARSPALQKILEEAGTLVSLDAVDCDGRTALMHAILVHRSHDVELLLDKGASVNLSDHLGFTALHYALHININEDFEFPRNYEELKKIKKIKEMVILFEAERHEGYIGRDPDWSDEKSKIIEMLLGRSDIDVNALSFEKFSPLDIVEGKNSEIPSSIKDSLKKKGAVLNAFRETESPSTSDYFHLDFTCKLTLKQIFKMVKTFGSLNSSFDKGKFQSLIEASKEQIVSGKDEQGRTALHLVAISFYDVPTARYPYEMDLMKTIIVDKLISLGCSVNETDNFGRTPLHYANKTFWELLISKGADASIKDKDGNYAIHQTSEGSGAVTTITDEKDKTYFVRLMNNRHMNISVLWPDPQNRASEVNLKTEVEAQWENGKYAFRHPLVEEITKEVISFMDAIAKEIKRLDPRFEIKPILVGSCNEGTRLDKPDEFDFCFFLTKISELCEVSLSPELPTGFVRLKRRPTKADETSDFDSFFGKNGILNTVKINRQFTTILCDTLVNIERQQNFEWIFGLSEKDSCIYDDIKKVFSIKMIKPLFFFTVDEISVDIVPCIHIDDWWPHEAISNVSDDIKKFGCNLIFAGSQELYPWVPYSESCARISFSKAESDIIKKSCDNAREAYMIAKMVTKLLKHDVSQYILKNCLLYCIEALSPSSEKASKLGLSLEKMKSKFHQMDRYLWLKCLLKCRLEFVAQDFCPCYFLPNFSSPIINNNYFKQVSVEWIADDRSTFLSLCKEACSLYRCTSNDISESSYQLPAPDPLWERFDRKLLIASLCEIAYK